MDDPSIRMAILAQQNGNILPDKIMTKGVV
jgi:hypothetical protein